MACEVSSRDSLL